MKKRITIILAICVLTMTGCTHGEIGTNNRLNDFDDAIMKAEYEGHSYIIYKGYYKGGLVHDPDCPCHKKGGRE